MATTELGHDNTQVGHTFRMVSHPTDGDFVVNLQHLISNAIRT